MMEDTSRKSNKLSREVKTFLRAAFQTWEGHPYDRKYFFATLAERINVPQPVITKFFYNDRRRNPQLYDDVKKYNKSKRVSCDRKQQQHQHLDEEEGLGPDAAGAMRATDHLFDSSASNHARMRLWMDGLLAAGEMGTSTTHAGQIFAPAGTLEPLQLPPSALGSQSSWEDKRREGGLLLGLRAGGGVRLPETAVERRMVELLVTIRQKLKAEGRARHLFSSTYPAISTSGAASSSSGNGSFYYHRREGTSPAASSASSTASASSSLCGQGQDKDEPSWFSV